MARLAGVNIPDNKHAVISLTYIFGIGRTTATKLCDEVGVNHTDKIKDLTEAQLDNLRSEISNRTISSVGFCLPAVLPSGRKTAAGSAGSCPSPQSGS